MCPPAVNVASAPSGTDPRVCGEKIGIVASSAGLKRTESGARTRTATDRSSSRISPAGTPSNVPAVASATCDGVSPTRFASAWLIDMSNSALGSATPL